MADRLPFEFLDTVESSAFLDAFCNKQCLVFEQTQRQRFEHILSWDTINALLTLNLLDEKRLRVVKESRDLPKSFYTREDDRRPIDAAKLTALVEQGASLAINGIQLLIPEVRRIADQLELWLDAKVNVNAYLSFSKGGAFTSHFDVHDVFVLQVHGDKAWTVYQDPAPFPLHEQGYGGRHAGRENPVLFDFVLRQGDMLFIPRGFYHKAALQEGISVHLTFGITTPRGIDVVDKLRSKCVEDAEFRKDIIAVAGGERLADQERALKEKLHAMVEAISLEVYVAKKRKARRPHDIFRFGPAKPMPEESVLVPLIRRRDSEIEANAALDPVAGKVIDRLLDHHRMTLRQLCDSFDGEIDDDDVRSTVSGLVSGQLIELA